jgi:translation initiation factor IF-2
VLEVDLQRKRIALTRRLEDKPPPAARGQAGDGSRGSGGRAGEAARPGGGGGYSGKPGGGGGRHSGSGGGNRDGAGNRNFSGGNRDGGGNRQRQEPQTNNAMAEAFARAKRGN